MKPQTFTLPWPPSVNSIWRAYKGRNILSQQARAWNDIASKELIIQKPKPVKGPVSVTIELCPPTKRAYDLDNRVKIILDLLNRCEIIEADDAKIVQHITVKVGTVPGALVSVSPLPTEQKARAA